jgi:hypothetical protein
MIKFYFITFNSVYSIRSFKFLNNVTIYSLNDNIYNFLSIFLYVNRSLIQIGIMILRKKHGKR